MDRKYYYIIFKNNKYRIGKDYIKEIQTDSIDIYYDIEFIDGVIRKNNEVFEQRRKARQLRDKLNKRYKVDREKPIYTNFFKEKEDFRIELYDYFSNCKKVRY